MYKIKLIKYIIVISTFISLIMSSTAIASASQEGAKNFIRSVSENTIKIISSSKEKNSDKEKKLIKMFKASVDTNWIAKFALGKHWRNANKEQQEKYIKLYEKFLISKYVPKFKEFTNQNFTINKSIDQDDSEYMVLTKIIQPDGPSINVNYKVRQYGKNDYRIFDVIAEGISLISTQRSDFNSVVTKKGLNKLITILEKKTS